MRLRPILPYSLHHHRPRGVSREDLRGTPDVGAAEGRAALQGPLRGSSPGPTRGRSGVPCSRRNRQGCRGLESPWQLLRTELPGRATSWRAWHTWHSVWTRVGKDLSSFWGRGCGSLVLPGPTFLAIPGFQFLFRAKGIGSSETILADSRVLNSLI